MGKFGTGHNKDGKSHKYYKAESGDPNSKDSPVKKSSKINDDSSDEVFAKSKSDALEKAVEEVKKPIGNISVKTRILAEEKIGSEIKDNPYGNSYEFENSEEYLIFNSEADARKDALESLENLYDDIGIEGWNEGFREQFIDAEQLRETLEPDVYEMNYERILEDIDEEEKEKDDFDFRPYEKQAQDQTDEQLQDPMQYMIDMEGEEQAMKNAISWNAIDKDALFEASIDEDGIAHTLAGYDGEEIELSDGTLMYRTN